MAPEPQRRPPESVRQPPAPARARIEPAVQGPVKKRVRAAENRRRASVRRRGLFWPTAKAGFAVTVVLGLSAGLGSVLGLPVPGLDGGAGRQSLASSAAFGIGAGTAPGLAPGYVFPMIGAPDFGDAQARFGASRYGHVHEGQDIFGKVGTPEVAVHDGVVVDRGKEGARYSGGRGNYVVIYDPAGNRSFVYMHMLRPPQVQEGDKVHASQLLGRLGCSGSCEGPHLHFEVRIGKATLRSDTKAVDPMPYLRGWPQATPE
ncbi:MAG TPA: M23 family metallopeptidase [Solirubrobacterales bacterium]|nr:M23 family metallopeptidase [Solirubrobacterales bacterium]